MSLPSRFFPKGLYIHVPFCASRCPYCDFYVLVSRDEQQHLRFAQRLIEQLDQYLVLRPDLLIRLETIFLGGGTPSLLGSRTLSYLLTELQARLINGPVIELSMESNPELIQAESLELWQKLGINRLSIGLQSCNDILLRTLGRRSSSRQHEKIAQLLHTQFSGQYSFDFIYGIPGQQLADIEESLDFIAHHQPHHVSYYELSIEEGSQFDRHLDRRLLPSIEQNEGYFIRLCQGLSEQGYQRYEVSNFARRDAQQNLYLSRHNELYWRWQPYLGLGPGAIGAALIANLGEQARVWRAQSIIGMADFRVRSQGLTAWQAYLKRDDFGVEYHTLPLKESFWEYLLMALRLRRGIDTKEFTRLFWPDWLSPQPKYLMELLQSWLPETMSCYADFFYWETNYLKLNEKGFDLQGAFLRMAYEELCG